MDWNRVQGSWKQLEGKVKAKWGKLTADDLTAINGRREELEGKIQQRYGIAKDQACPPSPVMSFVGGKPDASQTRLGFR